MDDNGMPRHYADLKATSAVAEEEIFAAMSKEWEEQTNRNEQNEQIAASKRAFQAADKLHGSLVRDCQQASQEAAQRIVNLLLESDKTPPTLKEEMQQYNRHIAQTPLLGGLKTLTDVLANMDLQKYEDVILHAAPLSEAENPAYVLVRQASPARPSTARMVAKTTRSF
jgi:hypothetical protein